jgi:hypothetical protein
MVLSSAEKLPSLSICQLFSTHFPHSPLIYIVQHPVDEIHSEKAMIKSRIDLISECSNDARAVLFHDKQVR